MVSEKEIKLNVSITKVIGLLDNEVLTEKEAAEVLTQFKKDDLIKYLTTSEEDLEEVDQEEFADQIPPTKKKPIETNKVKDAAPTGDEEDEEDLEDEDFD